MFNVPLLGNGRRHGNHITADMSGTWWDVTTQVSSKSVHWEASYGISNIFQHGGRPPFWIIKILIFDRVTVNLVLICCCVLNFIKIGSCIRPLDAHDCRIFNAPLLGNRLLPWQPHHGWHVGNVMGCDHPSFVQSVHCLASYGISNIFKHSGRPSFWFKKKLIFDHVTVIVILICCCVPNFIKIGSRIRPPDAHNCWMFNAQLLGNRIMANMLGTWWDATTQVSSKSVHW